MVRLAVVGLASSHVDHLLRHVAAGDLGDVRVTDVAVPDVEPVDDDRLAALRAGVARDVPVHRGDGATIAAALAGRVDAVVVGTRDARTHRDLADPLLRARLPLLVDKPFTADPEDAAHLVRLAGVVGVPLTSSSALRWHPGTLAAVERWRTAADGLVVTASGPADPGSPHGGLAFYAAHTVEAALAVLRSTPRGGVTVTAAGGARTVVVTAGRDVGVITVVAPLGSDQAPFRLGVAAGGRASDTVLDLGPDYLLPLLRGFVTGVATGRLHPAGPDLVASARVLAALCA